MKSILWVSWHPNPYNDFLFQTIDTRFNLDVVFIKRQLSTHPWKEQNTQTFKSLFWGDNVWRWKILQMLFTRQYDIRVIAGWDHPLMMCALLWNSMLGRSFCIWTDTPNPEQVRRGWRKLIHSTLVTFVVKNAQAVLVTGDIGVRNFKKVFPGKGNVLNFPFATDLGFFKPGIARKPDVFLTVGRMVNSHKGMDVALRAVAKLRERHPHLKFRYILIGTGPDRHGLQQYVESHGLAAYVEILDWMEPTSMLQFYQTSSFLVHPSHFDPYPNTVLEAMACGLPVIGSTSAGSVLDRVIPEKNGLWFQDGDEEDLTRSIELLLMRPEWSVEMGREARLTAERWSVEYNIRQLLALTNDAGD